MAQKVIHYVPGGWNGQAYVESICGATVSCEQASSLFTNCPKCKVEWRKRLEPVTDRVDY